MYFAEVIFVKQESQGDVWITRTGPVQILVKDSQNTRLTHKSGTLLDVAAWVRKRLDSPVGFWYPETSAMEFISPQLIRSVSVGERECTAEELKAESSAPEFYIIF
jgi:hypothetical protein